MAWNPNVPAVTNRVQDDLNAIRENFQVLDGHLADTNNPHQVTAAQVGAPTQAAFDAHVADTNNPHQVTAAQLGLGDVLTNQAQILGSRIVDHNLDVANPPNGYYVRWDNGLQVCWHRWEQEPVDPAPEGSQVNRKQNGVDVQFPAAFAVAPAADISQEPAYWRNANYGSSDSGISSLSAEVTNGNAITNTRIRFSYDLRTYRGRVQFSYKAIGVWK